jgi:ABC-2 type transport system ATP-binding protein
VTILDILREIGTDRRLKDVALEAPNIEEVIRTYYQSRNAGLVATS